MERPFLVLTSLQELLDLPEEAAWTKHALQTAVQDVCGVALDYDEREGHTTWTLVDDAFKQAGLGGMLSEETYSEIANVALREFVVSCKKDLTHQVRPGVVGTLDALQLQGVHVAPCSGMLETIGTFLLQRAKLLDEIEFDVGAWGVYGATCPDLIEHARQANAGAGIAWPSEKTVMVSSSEQMLQAGRSAGILCVGIGDDNISADAVINDISQLPGLLASWDALL